MAFNTAMIITPTSAKIAIHIFANTNGTQDQADNFDTYSKIDISYTMRIHLRAILIALEIFSGSSSISTISAASIAASEPRAPMAIPMSALDNTGASLIPSPTNASFSLAVFYPEVLPPLLPYQQEEVHCKPHQFPTLRQPDLQPVWSRR